MLLCSQDQASEEMNPPHWCLVRNHKAWHISRILIFILWIEKKNRIRRVKHSLCLRKHAPQFQPEMKYAQVFTDNFRFIIWGFIEARRFSTLSFFHSLNTVPNVEALFQNYQCYIANATFSWAPSSLLCGPPKSHVIDWWARGTDDYGSWKERSVGGASRELIKRPPLNCLKWCSLTN